MGGGMGVNILWQLTSLKFSIWYSPDIQQGHRTFLFIHFKTMAFHVGNIRRWVKVLYPLYELYVIFKHQRILDPECWVN